MRGLEIEEAIWEQGYVHIAGCDEVGRGCLFGPVLAASVILPKGLRIEGIRDSKKLSPKKREQMYEIIKEKAVAFGVGIVSAEIIDKINIKNATKLAMKKSVLNLKNLQGEAMIPDYLIIDAEEVALNIPQKSIIHGDDLSLWIGAASIVAKVIRDRMCMQWHEKYPLYGIDQHKGYGTKVHREALIKHGPSELHRKSFLKKILQ